MTVLNIGPRRTAAVRPVVRQRQGFELVGGENESEDAADLLTCTLDRFEAQMRRVYPDWQEFVEWAADRRALGWGFDGRRAGAQAHSGAGRGECGRAAA